MNSFINYSMSFILAIIDIYLINLYINKYLNLTKRLNRSTYIIIELVLLTLFNASILSNVVMNYSFLLIILFVVMHQYYHSRKQLFTFLITIVLLKASVYVFFVPLLEWVFNMPISTQKYHIFLSYQIFLKCIERYIELLILQFVLNRDNKFAMKSTHFKIISLFIFGYLCITILFNLESLFYFPGVGRTFVFIILVCIIMLILFDRYQIRHEIIERDMLITNHKIEAEKQFMEKKMNADEEIVRMRHDLKNSYYILNGYLCDNNIEEMKRFMTDKIGKLTEFSSMIHFGYTCIDSVIDEKIKVIKENDIVYIEEIAHIELGIIDLNDLALLIALAMDNAIEAAIQVKGRREIHFQVKNNQGYLILNLTNSIIPGLQPIFHQTSKSKQYPYHGYGVKEIKHFAMIYNGEAKYTVHNETVTLRITLSIHNKTNG